MELKMKVENLRQCYANNRKALFHKWVENDEVLLKINGIVRLNVLKELNEHRNELISNNVYSSNCTPEVIKRTYALVEFEDGTLDYIDPKSIRFIDGKSYFDDYCWD